MQKGFPNPKEKVIASSSSCSTNAKQSQGNFTAETQRSQRYFCFSRLTIKQLNHLTDPKDLGAVSRERFLANDQ